MYTYTYIGHSGEVGFFGIFMRDPNKALLIDEKEIRCLHPWKLGRAKSQDCSEAILAGFYQSSPCRFLRKQSLPVSTEAILAGFYGSSSCQFCGICSKVLRKPSLSVSMEAVRGRFLRKQLLPVSRKLSHGFTGAVVVPGFSLSTPVM